MRILLVIRDCGEGPGVAIDSWLCDGDGVADRECGYTLRNRWLGLRKVHTRREECTICFLCTQECVSIRLAKSKDAVDSSNIFSWFE